MWLWKCLVCEKDLSSTADFEGDDDQACLPNIEGGTVEIHFGYGSCFDDLNGIQQDRIRHQAFICDDCYEAKMHLTRPVIIIYKRKWRILDSDYRSQKRRRNQEK